MKLRLSVVAMTVSILAVAPVYAGGAGGNCAYGSKYKYTEAEPQEQSEASRKLASLRVSTTEQKTAGEAAASAPAKADSSSSQAAEKTTTQ